MQNNCIFDPSILFISEAVWRDEERRDIFLERFITYLEVISVYTDSKIFWTDALEELLINHIYVAPWVSDSNWSNQFFPVIYNKFNPLKVLLSDASDLEACQSTPPFLSADVSSEVLEAFLGLVHLVIGENESAYLCIGSNEDLDLAYRFSCQCHENQLNPTVIADPEDFFRHIDISQACWPDSSQDAFKFKMAVEMTLKTKLMKALEDICYEYEVSESFVSDISTETTFRSAILYSVAKRLTLIQGEAVSDKGLGDEPVRGKPDERRFRVSVTCRIHYKYSKTGSLVLLNYYGSGKHEKGLK